MNGLLKIQFIVLVSALVTGCAVKTNTSSFDHNMENCLQAKPQLEAELYSSISSCTWILGIPDLSEDLRVSVLTRRSELYDLVGLEKSAKADRSRLLGVKDSQRIGVNEGNYVGLPEDHRTFHLNTCHGFFVDRPAKPEFRIKSCSWLIDQPMCSEYPDSCSTFFIQRGQLYFESGHHDLALADYNQAIHVMQQSEPSVLGLAYAVRGKFFYETEQLKRALTDFDLTVELAPDWAFGFEGRAEVYIAQQEWGMAIQDLRHVTKQDPGNPTMLAELAWLLATREEPHRNPANAVVIAKQAIRASEKYQRRLIDVYRPSQAPGLRSILAAAFASAGKFDKALEQQGLALKMAEEEFDRSDTHWYAQLIELYNRGGALYCPGMPECGED